jgi:hypothetical protein
VSCAIASFAFAVSLARAAYESALAKLDPKSAYRNYVQVKHDAIPATAKLAESNAPPNTASPKAAPAVAGDAVQGKAGGAVK